MEMLDILDKHGNKTGKVIQRGEPLAQGEYFLIVDVWIMNSKGELLISKRTPTTEPEPNRWQPTCGCAITREDSKTAAMREVREELGINLNAKNGKMVKRFVAWDKAIIDVWIFDHEADIGEIILQPGETDDAAWVTDDHIKQLIKNDRFISNQRMPYIDELLEAMK